MQTATNPQTGEKIMWNGSAWVPAGSGQAPAPQLPRVLEGPPKEPSPQTTEQRQNTLTNVAQGQQSLQMTPPKTAADFIKDFTSDPAVKAYREVLPQVIAATQAGHNGAGDASVVYGWAKAMDPMGSVREGDTEMAQSTAGPLQRAQFLVSQYHLDKGGTLPPEVRQGLIEEMRNKGRQLDLQYSQKYQQTKQLLQQAGIDPSILGPHEGDKYRAAEEQYVRSVNGSNQGPTDPSFVALNGGPTDATNPGTPEFGGQSDPRVESMNPQQRAAYDAWFKATPNPTPEALNAFLPTIGVKTFDNAAQIIDAYKKSGQLGHDVTVQPDISDARGQGGFLEGADAAVRGAADTLSLGTADKLAAAGDTLFGGGTMQQNLQRQYAISDYDAQNNAGLRIGGQIAGGFALPVGEVSSVPNLAAKGAAYGAAYGAGSSRSLSDVPMNALLGAGAGAAVPLAIGGARKAVSAIRGMRQPSGIDAASEGVAMREQQIAAAGGAQDLGIQMPRFVAGGPTAQRLGALADQSQIGAPIIRRSAKAMLDQSELARNKIAAGVGTAKNPEGMGDIVIAGAGKARAAIKGDYRRVYQVAERLSGDTRVSLPTAKQEVLSQIAELSDTPGGVRPAIMGTLEDIATKLDGDWTPAGVRRMRSELRQRFVESGSDQGDASRRAQRITEAAENDMVAGLRAANKGDAAAAWQKASQMRAAYQKTKDDILDPILGINKEKTGAEVARALTSAFKNNPARVRKFMAMLPPDEGNDVRASIIQQMGNPGSGAQDVEGEAFSLSKLLTHWNDLKDVRNHIFPPETVKALNKLAMVADRAKQAGHVENHSQTGSIGIAMLTAGPAASAPGFLMTGNLKGAAAAAGTTVVLGVAQAAGAKMLASPKFAQWLGGLANAERTGSANAVRSQFGRLQKLATTNPELREGIEHLLRSIANDNAPAAGSAVASPDQGPEQQGQPQ